MDKGIEGITRDQLLRAIRATENRLPERATGSEALEALAREVESPHACVAAYTYDGGGPCEKCGEWVAV